MKSSAVLLAFTLMLLPACADRGAALPDPQPCDVPGLSNCARSGDVVFGGQPSAATLQYLASQGYTTVVSTRGLNEVSWDERAVVESLGMRFVQIPMENPVAGITTAQVAALDSVLANQSGPILLHCGSGNRVSGLWAAWLAERQGVEAAEALRLGEQAGMRGVRPIVEQRLRSGGP